MTVLSVTDRPKQTAGMTDHLLKEQDQPCGDGIWARRLT